jgi:replicative DNA helicase
MGGVIMPRDLFEVIEGNKKEEEDNIPEYRRVMLERLEEIDEKCWSKGTGYVAPRFPLITEATAGFEDGLYFVAAPPNVGKSALLMNIVDDLVNHKSNNMFGLYFTLDDTILETAPRMIAMQQRVKIDVIRRPQKYKDHPDLIRRRKTGFDVLKNKTSNMFLFDSNEVNTCEQLEDKIKEFKIAIAEEGREKVKFVIVIDSFNDLEFRDKRFTSKEEKFSELAKWVKDLSKTWDAIVMCTSHLRKLNGYRRPMTDDLKESGTIGYEANCTMLCHNEVGMKGEKADVYYRREGDIEKQPVIEVHFGKNKLSSFKGRIFCEFIPDYSLVTECPQEQCKQYNSMVFQV